MTISFGNTQISLEDGNTAAPQAPTPAPTPAKKKGHGKLLLLAGLGVAGYIAVGGASGIQGMINGGSAAGKTIDTIDNINKKAIDTIGNINENAGNVCKDMFGIDPELKDKVKVASMAKGAMAGRRAALNGGGKLMQKAAGAASLFIP